MMTGWEEGSRREEVGVWMEKAVEAGRRALIAERRVVMGVEAEVGRQSVRGRGSEG